MNVFVAFSLFTAVFYLLLENALNASGESDFKRNIINLPFELHYLCTKWEAWFNEDTHAFGMI